MRERRTFLAIDAEICNPHRKRVREKIPCLFLNPANAWRLVGLSLGHLAEDP